MVILILRSRFRISDSVAIVFLIESAIPYIEISRTLMMYGLYSRDISCILKSVIFPNERHMRCTERDIFPLIAGDPGKPVRHQTVINLIF